MGLVKMNHFQSPIGHVQELGKIIRFSDLWISLSHVSTHSFDQWGKTYLFAFLGVELMMEIKRFGLYDVVPKSSSDILLSQIVPPNYLEILVEAINAVHNLPSYPKPLFIVFRIDVLLILT